MLSVQDELTFDRVLESLSEFDRESVERVIASKTHVVSPEPYGFGDDAEEQLDEVREALSVIEKKFAAQPLTVDDLEPLRKALAA